MLLTLVVVDVIFVNGIVAVSVVVAVIVGMCIIIGSCVVGMMAGVLLVSLVVSVIHDGMGMYVVVAVIMFVSGVVTADVVVDIDDGG